MTEADSLRLRVFDSMNNCEDNGYDQTGCTVDEILEDILSYDPGFAEFAEKEDPEPLRPFVEEWLKLSIEDRRKVIGSSQ